MKQMSLVDIVNETFTRYATNERDLNQAFGHLVMVHGKDIVFSAMMDSSANAYARLQFQSCYECQKRRMPW